MGCHPTRCKEFVPDPDAYYNGLCSKIEEYSHKIVAIGECGLDYDGLHFCEKEIQKKYFEKQLDLVENFKFPLFLRCQNSHDDFVEIIKRKFDKVSPT